MTKTRPRSVQNRKKANTPYVLGLILILLGIYGLMHAGKFDSLILNDPVIYYALIVFGSILWVTRIFRSLQAFKVQDKIPKLGSARVTTSSPSSHGPVIERNRRRNVPLMLVFVIVMALILWSTAAVRKPVTVTTPAHPAIKTRDTIALLLTAAAEGNINQVRKLLPDLEKGQINSVVRGMTPLMAASSAGQIEMVRMLLDQGADPNKRGSADRTALQYAAEKNRIDIARLLLDYKADINGVDNTRLSPLVMTADRNFTSFALLLIDKGADVNMQHVHGWTALIDAARNGNRVLVLRLLQEGADRRAHTTNGWTAADYAHHNKHYDIELLLRQE